MYIFDRSILMWIWNSLVNRRGFFLMFCCRYVFEIVLVVERDVLRLGLISYIEQCYTGVSNVSVTKDPKIASKGVLIGRASRMNIRAKNIPSSGPSMPVEVG